MRPTRSASDDTRPLTDGDAPSGFRVVVDSPGTSDGDLIRAVTRYASRPQRDVARCFYQAPRELVDGLDRETAEGFARTLREAGAHARVLEPEAALEPGVGEWEAALVVRDLDRIAEVLHEAVRLLQVGPQEAIRIVCRTPAVLMGNLSRAAAEAIRDRFAAVGAEVDLSRPEHARYDLYVDGGNGADRRRLRALLERNASEVVLAGGEEEGGMVASGLSFGDLEPIRQDLLRHASGVTVLNRDFARFDLTLTEAGGQPEAVAAYLADELGIPRRVIPRMFDALPVVVAENVRADEAELRLRNLEDLGASGTADLLSWRFFSVVLRTIGDRERSEEVLRLLGELARSEARALLAERPPVTLPGAFTPLRARWIQRELGRVGSAADLEVR